MRKRPLEELEKEMKEIIDQYGVENLAPKVIDIDLIVPIGAVYEVDSPQLWFSFYFKHADKEVRLLFDDDNRFISDEGEI